MLKAIIQARLRSTHLPNKAMADLCGRPMLGRVADRVRIAIPNVVIATPDDEIAQWVETTEDEVFVGDEADVLTRYYECAVLHRADPIIRITSDCPFIDPDVLDQLRLMYARGGYDYISVATGSPGGSFPYSQGRGRYRYPDGLDAEIFSLAALRQAWVGTLRAVDREHVTPWIRSIDSECRVGHLYAPAEWGHVRLTVDTEADLAKARALYAKYGPHCTMAQALDEETKHAADVGD